ncbi:MAG: HEPN domain-containing protein [Planctomycetes bacterium]|nr:HEPN domain-containing protein [Planctomycetota bacterium]
MTREEMIEYRVETAAHDYPTVQHLYDSGDYGWCLFVGHLVIEKLLKACYVKRHGVQAPRIHSLPRLAELAELQVDASRNATLVRLTQFSMRGRYPDAKREFYKRATKEFTTDQLRAFEEIRKWLLTTVSG